jgi:hypothetical protein
MEQKQRWSARRSVDDGCGLLSVWRWPGSGDSGSDGPVAPTTIEPLSVPTTVEAVPAMITAASGQAGMCHRRAGGWRRLGGREL